MTSVSRDEVADSTDALRSIYPLSAHRPFVAVDWGTSSFRLWSLSAQGEVTDRASGPFGMAGLGKNDFDKVLEEQLASLSIGKEIPVVICGMAGAAQGWHEAPYASAPTALSHLGARAVKVPDIERDVRILPGIMQQNPADVMRGEETQLLGLLATQPDFAGIVCLPGTHSKWVQLQQGCIEKFTSCMTGEIFALLSGQSVLKHSTADGGWDSRAYSTAVEQVMQAPASFANSLFSLRADMLLNGLPSGSARGRLSGLLVGIELAATRSYWESSNVTLIGDASLCANYAEALSSQSIAVDLKDSETTTLAGLIAAFKQMQGSHT